MKQTDIEECYQELIEHFKVVERRLSEEEVLGYLNSRPVLLRAIENKEASKWTTLSNLLGAIIQRARRNGDTDAINAIIAYYPL